MLFYPDGFIVGWTFIVKWTVVFISTVAFIEVVLLFCVAVPVIDFVEYFYCVYLLFIVVHAAVTNFDKCWLG